MPRSRRRVLSPQAVDLALLAGQRCRAEMVALLSSAPIGGPEYAAASTVMAALDGLAETLTGDRTLWHAKAPPTPAMPDHRLAGQRGTSRHLHARRQ